MMIDLRHAKDVRAGDWIDLRYDPVADPDGIFVAVPYVIVRVKEANYDPNHQCIELRTDHGTFYLLPDYVLRLMYQQ